METQVCQKREKVQSSPLANSLLPPQHHLRRHRHLGDAIPNHPPLGDLSSPKEVGEPRSPKRHSGRPISGRSLKGTTLKPDSLPSSLGRRTAAQSSSAWRTPRQARAESVHISRFVAGLLPPVTAPSRPDPCRARLWPYICHAILRRPGPAVAPAPL